MSLIFTILALFYYLIVFSVGKTSLMNFILFSARYCPINVFILNFLQFCTAFFFLRSAQALLALR